MDHSLQRIPTGHSARSVRESQFISLTTFYLIPDNSFLKNWSKFMVFVEVFSSMLITYQACFYNEFLFAFIANYTFDIIFFVDIYFKMHTSFLYNGFWVINQADMRKHYINSKKFKVDTILNLPYDFFTLFGFLIPGLDLWRLLSLVRLPKFLRISRTIYYFRVQEQKLHAGVTILVLKILTYLIVIVHSIACIWFSLSCPHGIDNHCIEDSWWSKWKADFVGSTSPASIYVLCIYWTVTTMSTTGYGDIHATNDAERIVALLSMLTGMFFLVYVSGTIASTLSNRDSARVTFKQRLTAITNYMKVRNMDASIQQRVIEYYEFVWKRSKGVDVQNVFSDLPTTFKTEIALSLNNKIISNAEIFKDCSVGFRKRVALSMKLNLFTTNEYLCHKGDIGRVEVFKSDDPEDKFGSVILTEGGHCGEFGVVLGLKHETSVKATCNTDIYVLTREDLQQIFKEFPEDKEVVEKSTMEKREIFEGISISPLKINMSP
ncbi:Kinesin-like protein kif27 [Lobulomyces angularis]|nr:Kinesin-like protein kif27 [Lobulomyces angularis]